ncbi:MAG: alpha/beta fold hydrolase, partial [Bdellovibrionales bacterium]
LIIINGNLATYRWWQLTLNKLQSRRLDPKNKSHLTILDLPGCGGHAIKAPINFLDLVQDYKKLIQCLNLESLPSLLGHSTGGLIAAHLNAQSDLKFHHTALLNPVGAKGFTMNEQTTHRYSKMQSDFDYSSKVIGATIYNCDYESHFFKQVIAPDTFTSVQILGSAIVESMSGLDSTFVYKNMRSPTTLLYGEHDPLISYHDMLETAELSALTQLEVMSHVGHCPNIENPELMADILLRYLH